MIKKKNTLLGKTITQWQHASYYAAGLNDKFKKKRTIKEFIDDIQAEVNELYKAETQRSVKQKKEFDPDSFESELADVVFTCLTLAECTCVDLQKAMNEKYSYNVRTGKVKKVKRNKSLAEERVTPTKGRQ